ncbi:hypothetical protein, partial [Haloarcula rubripromontorii]|uniref:hypothetical protein n=1 Tax=Haloarcula rubripromontorii TaxID=1705562 RepID=UPI00147291F0
AGDLRHRASAVSRFIPLVLTVEADAVQRFTRANPTNRLPELELPGSQGLKEDDCGEEIPVFACSECGKPKYLGRCCASPICERDWPAAVKRKATTLAGKLEALRRKIYADNNGRRDVDFNHVVASLPGFLVDSKYPVKRALLVLKTLLKENWKVDSFAAIYHPYRIKKEYRKDQYEHDGEKGEGDMTWSDVLASDDPGEYLEYSPHFHLFFPSVRRSFDYLTAEAVADKSGWVFHRITKEGDSNVSVHDLEDLVYQVTYAFSHAGINEWSADRAELTSRMKGELHNMYISEEIETECTSYFCQAAPKLLGTEFADLTEASCDAEVPDATDESSDSTQSSEECNEDSSELVSTRHNRNNSNSEQSGADIQNTNNNESKATPEEETSMTPRSTQTESRSPADNTSNSSPNRGESSGSSSNSTTKNTQFNPDTEDETSNNADPIDPPTVDRRSRCGGELVPIYEAEELLKDREWCVRARHVSGLRKAIKEWHRRKDGEKRLMWRSDGMGGCSPTVVQLH